MDIAALVVAIVAALGTVMAAWYARNQFQQARNQVEEMRREFELSGSHLQISLRYGRMAAGAPLIVDLSNEGREEAHITDLIIRPYRQGLMVPGGFVQLPDQLLGPRPPLTVPSDSRVTWSFPWPWVTQQAKHLGFDGIRFEIVCGNLKRIFSEPVSASFVPFPTPAPSMPQRTMEERERRRKELMGPAMKTARDAEVNKTGGSRSPVIPDEEGEDK